MSAEDIAKKLWDLCDVLRDDGVTYHQYLNELTYILFLKLSEVRDFADQLPAEYRWTKLKSIKDNKELFDTYRELLATISSKSKNDTIKEIFTNASSTLRKPANLRTLISNIDTIDWFDDNEKDKIATIYEELLEKNAGEKKSGAGQYFTPRPLINVMVELLVPKIGERWNDPAAGTFGFMIAADQYLKDKTDNYYDLDSRERKFQQNEAFSGCELVQDAHRLALMNAKLHGLDSKIALGDTLSELGKTFREYDGILANPPFGTKIGGERPTRDDFTYKTSNKQLNFLQHIYRSLHRKGGSRAAVVLPDNVLFDDNDGQKIRRDLMDKCNLHTVLRLPTGIFYAQGIKTNVLFFERGKTERDNTKRVWFYDMRSDAPAYGKRTPFTREAFTDFVYAYTGGLGIDKLRGEYDGQVSDNKREKVQDRRWSSFTIKEIADKGCSLDIGLASERITNDIKENKTPAKIITDALQEIGIIEKELKTILELIG